MENEFYIPLLQMNSLQSKVHLFSSTRKEIDFQRDDEERDLLHSFNIPIRLLQNKHLKENLQSVELHLKEMITLHHYLFNKKQLVRDFITFNPVMRDIKIWAQQMAMEQLPIAICGTQGVGKRHLSQWIHQQDVASDGYFLQIDCKTMTEQDIRDVLQIISTLPENLLSQLLQNGTLYIHHIDWLSFDLQQELLELFFDQLNMRHKMRFIISLEHDLNESYKNGFICCGLYKLIDQYVVIPPLAERKQEISSFVSLFIKQASQRKMCQRIKIEKEAIDVLSNYEWPGNLIELQQFIEKLFLAERSIVTKHYVLGALPSSYVEKAEQKLTSLADAEKEIIERTLRICGNTLEGKKQAADILKISLSTLYNKMKIYDL